jgi:hypothetical protein
MGLSTHGAHKMASVPRENNDSPVELRLCSDKPMYKNIENKTESTHFDWKYDIYEKKNIKRTPRTRERNLLFP